MLKFKEAPMAKETPSKGCPNPNCACHKNKRFFASTLTFCPDCGEKLVYVCKTCYKQLPDGKSVYCLRHQAAKKDKKDQTKKDIAIGAGVAGGAVAAGITVFGIVKAVPKILHFLIHHH